MDPPEIVCNMNMDVVSNYARAQLTDLNIDTEHIIFVMPDCLDWDGGMAWGEMNGYSTWIPTRYASTPMAQVKVDYSHT